MHLQYDFPNFRQPGVLKTTGHRCEIDQNLIGPRGLVLCVCRILMTVKF